MRGSEEVSVEDEENGRGSICEAARREAIGDSGQDRINKSVTAMEGLHYHGIRHHPLPME